MTDAALDDLARRGATRLSAFKVPTRWVVTDSADAVPMTATAKVDKAGAASAAPLRHDERRPCVTRAIDCLVNVDFGDQKQPDWMVRVKEDYFKGGDSFFKSPELHELLDDMDANGVEQGDPHDARRRDAGRGRSASSKRARPVRARASAGSTCCGR